MMGQGLRFRIGSRVQGLGEWLRQRPQEVLFRAQRLGFRVWGEGLQGYLAHEKPPPHMTLQ